MSFGRFLEFLANGLALPKACSFDDKWEGLIFYSKLTGFVAEENRTRWKAPSEWIYVSCWCAAAEESDAMWKLYGRNETAIAVETSVQRLEQAALAENLTTVIHSSEVRYKPPKFEFSDVAVKLLSGNHKQGFRWIDAYAFFYKHTAFSFEKEFRLTIVDPAVVNISDRRRLPKRNAKDRLYLKATRSPQFLDKVIISPSAPSEMISVVQQVAAKHGISTPIEKSSLSF